MAVSSSDYDLKALLDVARWEPVQDELASLTRTAIITIDYKGSPVTKHSGRTAFCTVIRENPVSCKRCYRCDALAGLEAVRLGRPFIYLCHCGIVDVAVPIVVGEQYLGAVMFGQVRLPDGDRDGEVRRLVSEISSFRAEEADAREDLLEKYRQLPEMEYSRIVEIADLINAIVRYIVGRVVQNRSERLADEWVMKRGLPPSLGELCLLFLGEPVVHRGRPLPALPRLVRPAGLSGQFHGFRLYGKQKKTPFHRIRKIRGMNAFAHLLRIIVPRVLIVKRDLTILQKWKNWRTFSEIYHATLPLDNRKDSGVRFSP